MSDEPPPPPPAPSRVPPVLAPPLPSPPRRGWRLKAPAPLPPASPLRSFFLGLAVSAALGAAGTFLLLGLPGLLPLFVANTAITLFGGPDRLARMSDSSWGAALWVTLSWPLPFAPALALLTRWKPTEPPALRWILAFLVSFAWAVAVAFWVLLAA